ncbi:ABC transporter permease [Candidatus Saccharibacteria bacterium]|nr:ABC transporter permease [Candidatus Saccharibacteria bacterium]
MNTIKFVFSNIFRSKGRFIFTFLGIAIGMASFVALLSMGGSMRGEVTRQAEALGSDIMIMPENICVFNQISIVTGDTISELMQYEIFDDMSAIEGLTVIPHLMQKTGVEGMSSVIGGVLPAETKDFRDWEIEKGEYFSSNEQNAIVLGSDFAITRGLTIGDTIPLGRDREELTVIGILKPTSSNDDAAMFMPLATTQRVFEKEGYISYMSARVDDITKMDYFIATIEATANVQASTDKQLLGNALTILGSVNMTLQLIAIVALIAAAFGIINTMMTAVYERRREIGILQAIGAKRSAIFKIFILESGLYGLFGGIAGVAIGLATSVFAGEYISKIGANELLKGVRPEASFDLWLILSAVAFSLVISIAAGLYPAWKASKMTPMEAINNG